MMTSLVDILSPFTTAALSVGIEKWNKSMEAKTLRRLLRERLLREIRFNLAVIDELEGSALETVLALDISIIKQLFDQPLALGDLFPNNLAPNSLAKIVGEKTPNKKFKLWTKEIKKESQLIERAWQKLAIARFRAGKNRAVGDMKYLRGLFIGLRETLSTSD